MAAELVQENERQQALAALKRLVGLLFSVKEAVKNTEQFWCSALVEEYLKHHRKHLSALNQNAFGVQIKLKHNQRYLNLSAKHLETGKCLKRAL